MRLTPVRVVLVALVAVLITAATGTTPASAATFTYDARSPTHVAAPSLVASEVSSLQLSGLRGESASLSVDARGAYTTSPYAFIATETDR